MKRLYTTVFILMAVFLHADGGRFIDSYRYLEKDQLLTEYWFFTVGDEPYFAGKELDDSGWQTGHPGAPLLLPSAAAYGDTIMYWARTRFSISEELSGSHILLSIRIHDPFEVYLNGRMVFSYVGIPAATELGTREEPLVTLRHTDLYYGRSNYLAIRIAGNPQRDLVLPQATAFRINGLAYHPGISTFLHSETYATISLLIGIIFLTLFIYQRKDFEHLLFAFANFFFAFYFHRISVPPSYLPYVLSYKISKACLLLAVSLLVIFMGYFFDRPFRKSLQAFIAIIAVIGSVIIISVPQSISETDKYFGIVIIIPSFLGILGIAYMAYIGTRTRHPNAWIIFVGSVIAVLIGAYDMMIEFSGRSAPFWLQGMSIMLFNFSFFIALINRVMQIFKELEQYTAKVEQAVRNRTNELGKANKDLARALVDAQEANRAKNDFLANISHEIRTPLNCIVGFAEIVCQRPNNDAMNEYADLIVQESEKLQHLINEILDISKIEAGKIELVYDVFSVRELVLSVYRCFRDAVRQKGLDFSWRVDDDVPDFLVGDSFRIRQVLMNLTSNAVKFTHKGSVNIHVSAVREDDTRVDLRCQIEDTGIGIKESIKEHIFESFVQQDSSMVRRYGGTGLGTTISKQLVEMMAGTIGFSSEEASGSIFFFELPLNKVNPKELHDGAKADTVSSCLRGLHILLAEDYPPNRLLVESLLRDSGVSWEVAGNGVQALAMYAANTYDLVLMDIQMPEMDGCEATRKIREHEVSHGKKKVPIIGFTANAFPEDIKRYLSTGMNDVITKPVKRKDFFAKIERAFMFSRPALSDIPKPDNLSNTVFDYRALLDEMEQNRDVVKRLVNDFIQRLPEHLAQLQEELAASRFTDAHRAAHSIKGGASNLFAGALAEAASRLEAVLKDIETRDTLNNLPRQQLDSLFADLERVCNEFRLAAGTALQSD